MVLMRHNRTLQDIHFIVIFKAKCRRGLGEGHFRTYLIRRADSRYKVSLKVIGKSSLYANAFCI